jgi:outer membrane protein OmpA-like peptidoglycan-associated protein
MKPKLNILIIGLSSALYFCSCAGYYLHKGDKEYSQLAFSKAAYHYSRALSKETNLAAEIKLADCYRLMDNLDLAEAEYSKIVAEPGLPVMNYFYYAKILMEKRKYSLADHYFRKYLESRPGDVVARLLSKSCNSISSYYIDTTLWTLNKVNLLGVASAFGSVPFKDGIVFTADKEVKLDKNKSPWTGRSYMGLYFSKKHADGHWLEPELLNGDINGQYHEGPASFSQDGQVSYFTRSNCVKKQLITSSTGENNLKIYRAELVNGRWTNITDLPFNSNEYSTGHPCLSFDGKTLYFISDMPGGYGGTDLYKVTITGNTFTKPENLGLMVNTPGNEMFPYSDQDGSLYFSSDGRNTMGGLDVFLTSWDGSRWLHPENLNAPLNSSGDDYGYVTDPKDKTRGFVSSNRDGTDALYEVKKNPPTFYVIATVTEKATRQPIKNCHIELINGVTGRQEEFNTDIEGRVKVHLQPETAYTILASQDNFFAESSNLDTRGKKISETLFANFELNAMVIDKPIVLQNIYYDLDKWEIRPDAALELDKLVKILIDNPSISIEMGSHTDTRAAASYNLILSDKRAKAAVDYLISNGINAGRLKWKGYGFTHLVNRCKKGVECSEEEHQQNRRTEFKVIKIADHT